MKWFLLIISFSICFTAKAQFVEAGLFTGFSFYNGDIERSPNVFKDLNLSYGVFARYHFTRILTLRANVYRGRISGSDAYAQENSDRRIRNLSFRNDLTEVAFTAEINVLGYQPYGLFEIFSPYIFIGAGATFHNPQANYQDSWVNLQPLGTEGQGIGDRPPLYSKVVLAIPLGIGLKYALNDKWNVGIEFGARYTGFDYLDDLSTTYLSRAEILSGTSNPDPQLVVALSNRTGEYLGTEAIDLPTGSIRGGSEHKDWYYMAGLTLSYNFFDNGLVGSRNRIRRQGANCRGARF